MPALALSALAVVCAMLPHPGLYVGMGLSMMGLATGWVLYQRRSATPRVRLFGAGAVCVGSIAVLLCSARIVATVAVVEHLIDKLS